MNQTDEIQIKIDALIKANGRFALYRYPEEKVCRLVLQTTKEPFIYQNFKDVNNASGFVIAPFHANNHEPIIVISPDIHAHGWEAIRKALDMEAIPTLHTASNHPNPSEKESYLSDFKNFTSEIQKGNFSKLVLSRSCEIPLSPTFSPFQTFMQAFERYPHVMTYLFHTPESGTWLGATPETLLSGSGEDFYTMALAGTMPYRGETVELDDWDEKNRQEQNLVTEYINKTILKYGRILHSQGPYSARAGHLVHIKTDIHFRLHPDFNIGHIVNALHPTPAVCGLPKKEALEYIISHEHNDRRYFSGFVGWMDNQGESKLFVNLRCMNLTPQKATLYAGGGILATSSALSEWDETEEKMKIMKNLLA